MPTIHWGERVAIIGSGIVAVELAEYLARSGKMVNLVSSDNRLAGEVGKNGAEKNRADWMLPALSSIPACRLTVSLRTACISLSRVKRGWWLQIAYWYRMCTQPIPRSRMRCKVRHKWWPLLVIAQGLA
ncbi:MAG: NAD-binding protein [Cellvibrionales bacterium]|nr:NAD-binding protein [Cellvibrionales bacterium]